MNMTDVAGNGTGAVYFECTEIPQYVSLVVFVNCRMHNPICRRTFH